MEDDFYRDKLMLFDFFVKFFIIKCLICILIFDFFFVEINYYKNKIIGMLIYIIYCIF